MNNLKRYKEIMGKEFEGNDYSTEKFQDSKAVSNLIKEIERKSKMLINRDKELLALNEELEKLHSIIKEVREKVKEFCWDYDYETYSNMTSYEVKELAEILDKEEI